MALPPTRRVTASLGATVLVLTSSLAGCSITRDDDQQGASSQTDDPSETPSAEGTPSATTSPTASPSVTPSSSPSTTPSAAPTEGPSVTTSRAPTLTGALLTAAQMPRLNDEAPWTVRRTGAVSSRPFGLCQKFDLLSIGAVSAVERTFVFDDASAGQQVAVFPDRATALRAAKVFEAWHRDCARRVSRPNVAVGSITPVIVSQGQGWTYPVSWGRDETGQFHLFGLVVSGNRLSVVRIDHPGQDHNYERGKEPTELAVKAIAARLG